MACSDLGDESRYRGQNFQRAICVMSKLQSVTAKVEPTESEKESAAVPTGTATGHNDTKAESTTPVDTETEDLTGDAEDAEDAARDDPQADADPHILELARTKAK